MAVLPILAWPDPRLRQTCAAVERFDADLTRLADDMLETMYAAGGRGLAGPQVGAMTRLFVMDNGWKTGTPDPRIFVHPVILETGTEMASREEGCLSIPGCPLVVTRPSRLRLAWSDLAGRDFAGWFEGIDAVVIQHERDHLDGVLILDRVDAAALDGIADRLAALEGPAGSTP
jgi:peptide deformylase